MRQNTVCHGWKENLLWQLQEVVLRETLACHEGTSNAFAHILKSTPVILLGLVSRGSVVDQSYTCLADQGYVIDHHEVQQGIDKLCTVRTTQCQRCS